MHSLTQYQSKDPGLADLLNFAALVDDGVVQTKCGSFVSGVYYRGLDIASSTETQRNRQSELINDALMMFGSGWVAWFDVVRMEDKRYPAPAESFFTADVLVLIDNERRGLYQGSNNHYVSEQIMVLMYHPPANAERSLVNVATGGKKLDKWPADLLKKFKLEVADIVDRLSNTMSVRRMRGYTAEGNQRDELLDYLVYCVTGELTGINVPACGMYLDRLIINADLIMGNNPALVVEDKPVYIATVVITGFPAASHPQMTALLLSLPMSYRWSSRMIFLDSSEAINEIGKYRRKWKQKSRGFFSQVFGSTSGQVNQDALLMAGQAEGAVDAASSDLVRFGYYSSTVVIRSDDLTQLNDQTRRIRKAIQTLGFAAKIETLNTLEAWIGSIPCHPYQNVRRPMIHTLNFADIMPLAYVWPGSAFSPNPLIDAKSPALCQVSAEGSTPFRLNLHVGDVGHTLIFGPTGAGKSVLLCTLVAQFMRYRGKDKSPATVFALDRGRSLETLTRAAGGVHLDGLTGEGGAEMAPLNYLDSSEDIMWAQEWIADMVELQTDLRTTIGQREAIAIALQLMSETESDQRSITHLAATVQDNGVRDALRQYAVGGNTGGHLDGVKDSIRLGTFVTVEIDELLESGPKNYLPILFYLFRRFEKQLTGQPALLVLGEAWALLAHETFRSKIKEWLKTLRKANCAVIIETQSFSDVAKSGLLDVILESCPTRILLPNPDADKRGTASAPGPADYYQMMGLNSTDIENIRGAISKRHYYYVSSQGKRLFELNLGPVGKAFLAVSDKNSLRERRELEAMHGNRWILEWIKKNTGEVHDITIPVGE